MNARQVSLRGLCAAAAVAAVLGAARADWTQWRGPNRDGHALSFMAPVTWPTKLERRWKVETGIGHASPLIAGNAAYVFTREGDNEVVRRLDLSTGTEVWHDRYGAPYETNPAARAHGKGPKSTPLLAAGRLYTFGISGILSCYDASTGKLTWRKEPGKQFAKTSPDFGTALSPVADGGLVFVHAGGSGQGAILGLDARTGAQKWEWKGDGPSYASPMIFRVGGGKQLVTQTQKMIVSLDPATGRLLWSLPFTTPYEQNIITPIQSNDLLIFGGLQQATFAVRLQRNGDTWKPVRVWECRDANFYMSTPILVNGKLYGMSFRGRGTLVTIDAATGKLLWSGEGRLGDNASLLWGGNALMVLPQDGEMRILRPNGNILAPLARYTVAESATWATPAIDRNHVLIKDQTSLTLWDLPSAGRQATNNP